MSRAPCAAGTWLYSFLVNDSYPGTEHLELREAIPSTPPHVHISSLSRPNHQQSQGLAESLLCIWHPCRKCHRRQDRAVSGSRSSRVEYSAVRFCSAPSLSYLMAPFFSFLDISPINTMKTIDSLYKPNRSALGSFIK